MEALLTRPMGYYPLGIWLVLGVLVIVGGVFTVFAQGLSLVRWSWALKLGLQEDRPDSDDPVERTMAAVSWGEAGADIVIQGILIVVAVIGILTWHPIGWFAAAVQAVIWIYVTLLVLLQRIALYRGGVEPDLKRFWKVGPMMVLVAGVPAVVMLVSLFLNRELFLVF